MYTCMIYDHDIMYVCNVSLSLSIYLSLYKKYIYIYINMLYDFMLCLLLGGRARPAP